VHRADQARTLNVSVTDQDFLSTDLCGIANVDLMDLQLKSQVPQEITVPLDTQGTITLVLEYVDFVDRSKKRTLVPEVYVPSDALLGLPRISTESAIFPDLHRRSSGEVNDVNAIAAGRAKSTDHEAVAPGHARSNRANLQERMEALRIAHATDAEPHKKPSKEGYALQQGMSIADTLRYSNGDAGGAAADSVVNTDSNTRRSTKLLPNSFRLASNPGLRTKLETLLNVQPPSLTDAAGSHTSKSSPSLARSPVLTPPSATGQLPLINSEAAESGVQRRSTVLKNVNAGRAKSPGRRPPSRHRTSRASGDVETVSRAVEQQVNGVEKGTRRDSDDGSDNGTRKWPLLPKHASAGQGQLAGQRRPSNAKRRQRSAPPPKLQHTVGSDGDAHVDAAKENPYGEVRTFSRRDRKLTQGKDHTTHRSVVDKDLANMVLDVVNVVSVPANLDSDAEI